MTPFAAHFGTVCFQVEEFHLFDVKFSHHRWSPHRFDRRAYLGNKKSQRHIIRIAWSILGRTEIALLGPALAYCAMSPQHPKREPCQTLSYKRQHHAHKFGSYSAPATPQLLASFPLLKDQESQWVYHEPMKPIPKQTRSIAQPLQQLIAAKLNNYVSYPLPVISTEQRD